MKVFFVIMLFLFTLEARSLFANDALKDLIVSTQKTRGLTNNYLNGNTVSMLLVYESRKDMKKASFISQSLITINRKAFKNKSILNNSTGWL